MGSMTDASGKTVQLGKKLCRGAWNARPYGDLDAEMVKGVEEGTDFYFNKSKHARLCALCFFIFPSFLPSPLPSQG